MADIFWIDMHKAIIENALGDLDSERSRYVAGLIERLEKDPRAQKLPNLIYLVLKETMTLMPICLEEKEVAEHLIRFVEANQNQISRIIFDPGYINNPAMIARVTDQFTGLIVDIVMEKYTSGQITETEERIYRFSWDGEDPVDFPYKDDEDGDDDGIEEA